MIRAGPRAAGIRAANRLVSHQLHHRRPAAVIDRGRMNCRLLGHEQRVRRTVRDVTKSDSFILQKKSVATEDRLTVVAARPDNFRIRVHCRSSKGRPGNANVSCRHQVVL